jgi:hypothetical protein
MDENLKKTASTKNGCEFECLQGHFAQVVRSLWE